MTFPISDRARVLLEILQLPGVGPARVRRIFANGFETVPHSVDDLMMASEMSDSDLQEAASRASQIINECRHLTLSIVSIADECYPPMLRAVADAPPILYLRGSVQSLVTPSIAVVGTRHASEDGLGIARDIGRYLASKRYCVVSGLALGIDSEAHLGALEGCGSTVAVLAHGLDAVHPTSNRKLAERILSAGGALVSEHPPHVPPRRHEFVRRNRIQSGMSLCSIMVESGTKGGAIHQAVFAREQGRKVLVVLPSESEGTVDFNKEGARYLIDSLGAIPIKSTLELRKELNGLPIALRPKWGSLNQGTFGW